MSEHKFDVTHYQRLSADCYESAMYCMGLQDYEDAKEFQGLGAYWSKIARKKMGIEDNA